jgi:hypothetical protein
MLKHALLFFAIEDPIKDEFYRHGPDQFNVYWKDVDGTDITGDDDGNSVSVVNGYACLRAERPLWDILPLFPAPRRKAQVEISLHTSAKSKPKTAVSITHV